jgi:phenylacetate-CoA ligase
MYRWLVPHVVFPLVERVTGRRVWSEVLRLRELQWRRSEELEARALARLQPVLRHAAAHVPYYRQLFSVLTITRKRGIRDRAHAEVGCAGEVS